MRLFCMALIGLTIGVGVAHAQEAPDVLWEIAAQRELAGHVTAVAWAPDINTVAIGTSDRWVRVRRTANGAQLYAVQQPPRSRGVTRLLFSWDGAFLGVQNASNTLGFRVLRAKDGLHLGNIVGSVRENGLVSFAADAALLASVGGDGTMHLWPLAELTVSRTTGSGSARVTTVYGFSPDGRFQTAASKGAITVQRRRDGAIVAILKGGPVTSFSRRSDVYAVASESLDQHEILLYGTATWTLRRRLRTPEGADVVVALRFTPDGERLVATGYLPYIDNDGVWQQEGVIRFWRVADGRPLWSFDRGTHLGVTSAISWSPDGKRFVYGLYDGSVAVAQAPR
jgi:WD40 repeat protein